MLVLSSSSFIQIISKYLDQQRSEHRLLFTVIEKLPSNGVMIQYPPLSVLIQSVSNHLDEFI